VNAIAVSARRLFRCSALVAGALICFGSFSCFRGYDLSKLKCSTEASCPKGYSCVWLPEEAHGTCTPAGVDGSPGDRVSPGPDSKTDVDGVLANDGLRGIEAGGADGHSDDAGGTGGRTASGGAGASIDAPAGGSGGTIGGLETTGGMPSTGGTIAMGGKTANLDGSVEDQDAPAPLPDAGLPKGASCSGNGQCTSTLCIDGFCCEKPCSGCNACAKAMTGQPDGTCAPVSAGNDPHKACDDDTTATPAKPCGNDGTCDGKGGCRKVGAGQECGAASCSSNGTTFTPASKCDGNGTCVAATPQVCSPYDCAVTGCKKTCTTQNQCDTGTYCDITAGTCVTKKTNGKTATQTYECESGVIADGVCCNSECKGVCESCSGDTPGTCSYVTGTSKHGTCPGTAPCQATCQGTSASCTPASTSTVCREPSCDSATNVQTNEATCTTAGSCPSLATHACSPFRCGSTACRASCATNDDCVLGAVCSAGACAICPAEQTACPGQCINLQTSNTHCGSCTATPCAANRQCARGSCKLVDGQPCTTNSQCASAICTFFYYDRDKDGYPVSGNSVGYCNATSSPNPDYIPAHPDGQWDCCDTDATVNPGVTGYFIDAKNDCHTWDWNCSGQLEKEQAQIAGDCWFDTSSSSCVSTIAPGYPTADCGGSYAYYQSCMQTTPGECTSTTAKVQPVACH
jgi:hypothetical protein